MALSKDQIKLYFGAPPALVGLGFLLNGCGPLYQAFISDETARRVGQYARTMDQVPFQERNNDELREGVGPLYARAEALTDEALNNFYIAIAFFVTTWIVCMVANSRKSKPQFA